MAETLLKHIFYYTNRNLNTGKLEEVLKEIANHSLFHVKFFQTFKILIYLYISRSKENSNEHKNDIKLNTA